MGCLSFPHSEEAEPNRRRFFFHRWTRNFGFGKAAEAAAEDVNTTSNNNADVSTTSTKLNELTEYTLAEIKAATRNFHEKIGEGGFGAVYKGLIRSKKLGRNEDKVEVAVKKLNVKGMQGQKEWLSEVTYLRLTDHPNLVKLLGYCMEDDERGPESLLVYEYVPNKSLDDYLFRRGPVLPWKQRLQVAIGTAKGLAYLHEEMTPQIIYRDLKASNILLDNEFRPKLSDFGLARYGPEMGNTHVTTQVVGTPGYASPEYIQTGHLTAKSDVWSFGMVLLELVTGRRALDRNRPRSERSLADWARPYMNDSRRFQRIVDPRLRSEYPLNEARQVLALVQKCTGRHQKARPKMSEVARRLIEITDSSPSVGISIASRNDSAIDEESGSMTGDSSREHSSYFTTNNDDQRQSVGTDNGEGMSSAYNGQASDSHVNSANAQTSFGEDLQNSMADVSRLESPGEDLQENRIAVLDGTDGSVEAESSGGNAEGTLAHLQPSRPQENEANAQTPDIQEDRIAVLSGLESVEAEGISPDLRFESEGEGTLAHLQPRNNEANAQEDLQTIADVSGLESGTDGSDEAEGISPDLRPESATDCGEAEGTLAHLQPSRRQRNEANAQPRHEVDLQSIPDVSGLGAGADGSVEAEGMSSELRDSTSATNAQPSPADSSNGPFDETGSSRLVSESEKQHSN